MARLYCNETCRSSWKCDRAAGAFYPAVAILRPSAPPPPAPLKAEDIEERIPWTLYTRQMGLCRYCGQPVPKRGEEKQCPIIEGQLELPDRVR